MYRHLFRVRAITKMYIQVGHLAPSNLIPTNFVFNRMTFLPVVLVKKEVKIVGYFSDIGVHRTKIKIKFSRIKYTNTY